ncbi:NADH dehydrogenase [ubiquinone] 1 alpha subcomplex assembly factor 8 isoform X2 [Crocuta crocuta]
MSGNAAVWGRVRGRLRAFPERLAACGAEAAAYGRCVQASTAPGGRLTKDLCVQEFEALRSCFAAMSPRCACCPQEPSAVLTCHLSQKVTSCRPRAPGTCSSGLGCSSVCHHEAAHRAKKTPRGGL